MPSISRQDRPASQNPKRLYVTLVVAIACAGTAHLVTGCAPEPHTSFSDSTSTEVESVRTERFSVTIRKPDGPPTIKTGIFDDKGNPVTIACATCHTTNPANVEARLGTSLKSFHQGLIGKHAALSCVSCHNAGEGFGSLRLADGKSLPYSDVMTLCAQCHGPQFRDYQHGAHGGMTGHWDLTKGGRVRNNCINCHDPHAPKYPVVAPAAGPNDRFLKGVGHE